jgi:hypothetical protein
MVKMAQPTRTTVIHISGVNLMSGRPCMNRWQKWLITATAAASSAIRKGASAGRNDCGAINRMNVKAMKAQNGTALSVVSYSGTIGDPD